MDEEEFKLDLEVDDGIVHAASPMALFMDVLPQTSAKKSTVTPSRKRQPPRNYSPGGSQTSNLLIEQPSTSAVKVEDSSAALHKAEENDDGDVRAAKRPRKAITSRFSPTPSSLPSTPKAVVSRRIEKVILSDFISAVVKAQKGTVEFVFPYPDLLPSELLLKKLNGRAISRAKKEVTDSPSNPKSRASSAFIKLRGASRRSASTRGVDSAERSIIKTEENISPQVATRSTSEVSARLSAGVSRDRRDIAKSDTGLEGSDTIPESSSASARSSEIKDEIKEEMDVDSESDRDMKSERVRSLTSSSLGSSRRSLKNTPSTAVVSTSSNIDTGLRRSDRSANLTPKMRERLASGAAGTIVGDKPKVAAKPNSALAIRENLMNRRTMKVRRSHSPDSRAIEIDQQSLGMPVSSDKIVPETTSVDRKPVVACEEELLDETDREQLLRGNSVDRSKNELKTGSATPDNAHCEEGAISNSVSSNIEGSPVEKVLPSIASTNAADTPGEHNLAEISEEANSEGESDKSLTDTDDLERFIAVSTDSSVVNTPKDEQQVKQEESPEETGDIPLSLSPEVHMPKNDPANSRKVSFADPPRTGRGKGNLLSQCPPELIKTPELPSRTRARRTIRPTRFDDYVTEGVRPVTSKQDLNKEALPKATYESNVKDEEEPVVKDSDLKGAACSTDSPVEKVVNKEHQRIFKSFKIKLRLGGDRTAQIIEDSDAVSDTTTNDETLGNEVEDSVEAEQNVVPVVPKKKQEKPRRTKTFVMSFKEAIPDWVRPDGSVEKLGMTVNKVMDKILETVCDDGIARHMSVMSSSQRKSYNSKKANDRYWKEKELKEQYINECRLKGVEPVIISNPNKSRKSDIVSSIHRSERVSKGALYNEVRHNLLPKSKREEERRRLGTPDTDPDFIVRRKKSRGAKGSEHRNSSDREPSWFSKDGSENGFDYDSDLDQYERVESILAKEGCHGLVDKYSLLSRNDLTAEHDFFYRDVLADVVSTSPSRYCDDDIDIETVDPMKTDNYAKELGNRGSTDGLANNIEILLMRPASPCGTYGMSDLFLRAKEESELHRAILDRAVDIILDYHSAGNSSTVDSFNDLASVNSGCSSSVALRDLFSMYYSDRKPAIVWVHRFLVEFLPVDFLASYMNLLKTCRTLRFLVVKKIIMETVGLDDPWPRITEDILTTTKPSTAVKDAMNEHLDSTVAEKCLKDVVFLILAPPSDDDSYTNRTSHIAPLFKWLTKMGDSSSQIWNSYEEVDTNLTIAEYGDFVIEKIMDKIGALRKSHQESRIVVVGYRTTCFFAHRAAQLTQGISAIVDVSFPLITSEGPRGDPDDDILLTYCPSLFVVGADADDFDPVPMKDMRSLMISRTGLVVVANADEHLNVSTSVLTQAGITQSYVFRMILEHIYDFLNLGDTMQERAKLAPLQLNRLPFHIAPSTLESLKPKITSANEPAKKPPRKRKADAGNALPLMQEGPVKPSDHARQSFTDSLKRAKIEPVGGKPVSREFKVPMLPQHVAPADYRPMPPSTAASSSSYVDPSSISLG